MRPADEWQPLVLPVFYDKISTRSNRIITKKLAKNATLALWNCNQACNKPQPEGKTIESWPGYDDIRFTRQRFMNVQDKQIQRGMDQLAAYLAALSGARNKNGIKKQKPDP